MYIYLQDMKFLGAMLLLGQLYTDNNTNDDATTTATDAEDNDDTNDR